MLAYLNKTPGIFPHVCSLHTGVSASLSPEGGASEQSPCTSDTANTSTKACEDVGWVDVNTEFEG